MAEPRFPVPPRQHDPWAADPGLPPVLREVAQVLFEHGFADPRGCEYREVELVVGDLRTGEARTVKTHGFVLPGQPYAIAWNGLVYPTTNGGKLDLAADVAALLAGPELELGSDEAESVLPARSPQGVLLLARLGEAALANQVWSTFSLRSIGFRTLYGSLVTEWTWRIYDRAITAHMRGAQLLALESLRLLDGVQAAVEATAAAHKLYQPPAKPPYLAFLRPLPALLADEQRRARRGPHPPLADDSSLSRLSPAARTATLIDHLDEIAVRKDPSSAMQDGEVELSSDPIVQALIQIGPPAVEPLIEVVASDARLTRSVRWSEASLPRWPVHVAEPAYLAITRILDTARFRDTSYSHISADHHQLADDLRAYWRRWKSAPVEERWLGDLADDDAGPEIWLDAASQITSENDGFGVASSGEHRPASAAAPGMRGEPLRGHRAPSVADLLAMRIEGVGLRDGCLLAVMLSRWDPTAGAPWLDHQLKQAIEETETSHRLAAEIRMLTEQALATGHPAVLDVYAAWLEKSLPPATNDDLDTKIFAPMAAAPRRPSIARAAERMFRDGSPWVPLLVPQKQGRLDLTELLYGDLITVPAFNRHVLKSLSDRRPIGGLELIDGGVLIWTYYHPSTPFPIDAATPRPAVGTKRTIRMADWYAEWLTKGRRDAPRFELFWTEQERNKALVAIAAWLKR